MTQILMLRRLRIVRRVRGSGGDADGVGRGVALWAGSIVHTFNAIRRDLEEVG